MSILVLLQGEGSELSKASLITINVAREIAKVRNTTEINAIVLGSDSETLASSAKEYGFGKIYFSNQDYFKNYISTIYGQAVHKILTQDNVQTLVLPANSTGKDLAPWIAGKWEAGQASDIVSVNADGSYKRPVYAGNAFVDLEIKTPNQVITVRVSSFSPAEKSGATGSLERKDFEIDLSRSARFIKAEISKVERPELAGAEYVVSGGRALGSEENFKKYIFPVADSLGAAVGASRAAVDAGYAPNDWQVGQTGKIVAPKLYIAAGISGAIQHIAGMKDSKVIVAINKDPDAPIFEVADFGLVGDIFEILPRLTDEISKARK